MPPPPPNFSLPPPPLSGSAKFEPFSVKETEASPKTIKYQEKQSHSLDMPKEKSEDPAKKKNYEPPAGAFKPSKIIQKKQVSYSKTLNKPKETPIPKPKKFSPKDEKGRQKDVESPKK